MPCTVLHTVYRTRCRAVPRQVKGLGHEYFDLPVLCKPKKARTRNTRGFL